VTERHFGDAPVQSASTVPSARYGTWRYGGSARVILSLIPVDIESRAAVGSRAEMATPPACTTHRRSVASSRCVARSYSSSPRAWMVRPPAWAIAGWWYYGRCSAFCTRRREGTGVPDGPWWCCRRGRDASLHVL
jgi:hypothetical protein